MHPEAEELNSTIKASSGTVFSLLSKRGKGIYFPAKGILSQSAQAKGKKLNATIGTAIEDDGTPMRLHSIEKMVNLAPDFVFPYAPSYGRPDLRKRWQEHIKKDNPSVKSMSLPIVTTGLTHGLSMAGYLFADEGDEIILPDLNWENYSLIFEHAYGAKLKTFPLFKGGKIDIDSLKRSLHGHGKKILLLNFPNNPSGYTPTKEEAKEIVDAIHEAASHSKILVICDDAYYGLFYEEDIETQSIFAFLSHENVLAIKIDGASKEDYVWGFRVAFMTYGIKDGAPELYAALEHKTAGAVRGNLSNASNLTESLLLKAYESPDYEKEKEEKKAILEKRYKKVREVLEDERYGEFFTPLPFNSGYFMCIEMKKDAEKIRQVLLEKYDTGVICFGKLLRVAFSALKEHDVKKLFDNIFDACKSL